MNEQKQTLTRGGNMKFVHADCINGCTEIVKSDLDHCYLSGYDFRQICGILNTLSSDDFVIIEVTDEVFDKLNEEYGIKLLTSICPKCLEHKPINEMNETHGLCCINCDK